MPADILNTIVESRKIQIEQEKIKNPLKKLQNKPLKEHPSFKEALQKEGLSIIAEIKKASPSKGIIAEDFDPAKKAKEYEKAGAAAISCLSEPNFFLGKDEYISLLYQQVKLPILRKDFIYDEYMIYQAAYLGASAVLLIVSILEDEKLKKLIEVTKKLKMDALVEVHDEKELERALKAGAEIIGVNNRNLKDFSIDMNNAANLKKKAGDSVIFVSESGIQSIEDGKKLKDNDIQAVLIGEFLMRSQNVQKTIKGLKEAYEKN